MNDFIKHAPSRIQALPRNKLGYPIPWFAAYINGEPDFRIIEKGKVEAALRYQLCWICGEKMGKFITFVIGPMCAINRISSESPNHRDCAIYAARICPFLSNPEARRRERGLPEEKVQPAGVPIMRNPGVTLLWTTKSYSFIKVPKGHEANAGLLLKIGDPTETLWYTRGRPATGAEVKNAIDTGCPTLMKMATGSDEIEMINKGRQLVLDTMLPKETNETITV